MPHRESRTASASRSWVRPTSASRSWVRPASASRSWVRPAQGGWAIIAALALLSGLASPSEARRAQRHPGFYAGLYDPGPLPVGVTAPDDGGASEVPIGSRPIGWQPSQVRVSSGYVSSEVLQLRSLAATRRAARAAAVPVIRPRLPNPYAPAAGFLAPSAGRVPFTYTRLSPASHSRPPVARPSSAPASIFGR